MKRFLFWEYRRGSWQYDLMVGLILAFIFLTPKELFRAQPRAANIVMLPGDGSGVQFWMEPDQLSGVAEPDRVAKANQLLKNRTGKQFRVSRLEPIFDSEDEIKGYMAYATQ